MFILFESQKYSIWLLDSQSVTFHCTGVVYFHPYLLFSTKVLYNFKRAIFCMLFFEQAKERTNKEELLTIHNTIYTYSSQIDPWMSNKGSNWLLKVTGRCSRCLILLKKSSWPFARPSRIMITCTYDKLLRVELWLLPEATTMFWENMSHLGINLLNRRLVHFFIKSQTLL